MTVSALVRVLVESVLPDMHQKYVVQNLKASEWYRQYKSFVPNFLRGRPHSLIIHCLERQACAKKFDEDNVRCNPESGTFTILKHSKGSHTVNFGVDGSEPSCTCKDWKKWKIPCKHFFAVFNTKPEWGWNTLPQSYLQSAYLSCDMDTVTCFYEKIGEEISDVVSQPIELMETELSGNSEFTTDANTITELHSTDQLKSTTQLESSESLEVSETSKTMVSNHLETTTQQNDGDITVDEIPKKKVSNIMHLFMYTLCKQRKLSFPLEAMKVRANLKQIENITYQFSDDQTDMLKDLNSRVQDLFTSFHSLLPQKNSLVLRPKGSQSVVIMRRKIRKARLTLSCSSLSTTVKAKRKANRVGSKADWLRKLQVSCISIV